VFKQNGCLGSRFSFEVTDPPFENVTASRIHPEKKQLIHKYTQIFTNIQSVTEGFAFPHWVNNKRFATQCSICAYSCPFVDKCGF
jgi:hypothetical protein